ncbi:MAG: DUF4330 family protein [Acidobacteria bacterium]|nr:DUF4330 family protein [Acidobacteriota bacterium]
MAMIDQEGRLFGGVNLFDAVAGVVVLIMLALGVAGYRILRVPVAPTIATLTPSTVTAGPDIRIAVKGDNLLPYLRLYLQRTNKPSAVMHDLNPMTSFDNYALVNYTQARFLVESPQLAEIRLPDNLLPGTYDFILQNEANIVAVREAAVVVNPPPPPPPRAGDPKAVVRVRGAFTNLTKEVAAKLAAGARLPGGSAESWGEILSVKPPAPAEVRLDAGEKSIVSRMTNRWQVGAELRARCDVDGFKCYLPGGALLAPGKNVQADAGGTPVIFVVSEIAPDEPERAVNASVTIRLQDRPEVLALIREQDADVSPGGDRDSPARIVALGRRSERTSELNESLIDGTVRGPEKVGVLECTLRVPVTKVAGGWSYRSQVIKAGAAIVFQTDAYVVRGTITSVTVPR